MQSGQVNRSVIWGLVLIAAGLLLLMGNFNIVFWPLRALSGALALGIPGLIFASVYAGNRDQWWAIIPAGVILTLAGVALVECSCPGSTRAGSSSSGWR